MATERYRKLFPPALSLLILTAAPGLSSAMRTLSLEERIAAQERIERVVCGALNRSVALEIYWRWPITGEMLDREMARMESGSRMPEGCESCTLRWEMTAP